MKALFKSTTLIFSFLTPLFADPGLEMGIGGGNVPGNLTESAIYDSLSRQAYLYERLSNSERQTYALYRWGEDQKPVTQYRNLKMSIIGGDPRFEGGLSLSVYSIQIKNVNALRLNTPAYLYLLSELTRQNHFAGGPNLLDYYLFASSSVRPGTSGALSLELGVHRQFGTLDPYARISLGDALFSPSQSGVFGNASTLGGATAGLRFIFSKGYYLFAEGYGNVHRVQLPLTPVNLPDYGIRLGLGLYEF